MGISERSASSVFSDMAELFFNSDGFADGLESFIKDYDFSEIIKDCVGDTISSDDIEGFASEDDLNDLNKQFNQFEEKVNADFDNFSGNIINLQNHVNRVVDLHSTAVQGLIEEIEQLKRSNGFLGLLISNLTDRIDVLENGFKFPDINIH